MLAPNAFDPIDQAQDSRKVVHPSNQDIETSLCRKAQTYSRRGPPCATCLAWPRSSMSWL